MLFKVFKPIAALSYEAFGASGYLHWGAVSIYLRAALQHRKAAIEDYKTKQAPAAPWHCRLGISLWLQNRSYSCILGPKVGSS